MAKKETDPNPTPGMIKDVRVRALVVLVLLVLGLAGIYAAYIATFLTLINQVLLALIFLVVAGNLIRWFGGFNGWNAMYLLATKRGLSIIDNISKRYKWFWEGLSIWGLVIGLGLLSWPFLKGRMSKKLFVFGIISLYFMLVVVTPYTITGVQFITVSQIQSLVSNIAPSIVLIPSTLTGIVIYGLTIIAGTSGFVVSLLAVNAANVIYGISRFLLSVANGMPQTSTLANQIPGVIPVIPGITIPLIAGLAALVILLIVHEFSHGILARIAKINVKSMGVLMFGVLPIGAFVEPDEKQVLKLDSMRQTRIFAAGSSTNFLFSVVFLVLVVLFAIYVIPGLYSNTVLIKSVTPGYPAYNVLEPGMQILQWKGYPIENLSSFDVAAANDIANSTITVATNTGTYSFKAVGIGNSTRGYIGIDVYQPLKTTPLASLGYFLYEVFALSLAFNFFVAIFNLLPIPIFDGWRVYKSNMKSEKAVRYFAYLIVALVLLNVVATLLSFVIP